MRGFRDCLTHLAQCQDFPIKSLNHPGPPVRGGQRAQKARGGTKEIELSEFFVVKGFDLCLPCVTSIQYCELR